MLTVISTDQQQLDNMRFSSTTHCFIYFLDFMYLEKCKTSEVLVSVKLTTAFVLVNIIIKEIFDMGMKLASFRGLLSF